MFHATQYLWSVSFSNEVHLTEKKWPTLKNNIKLRQTLKTSQNKSLSENLNKT